MSSAIVALVVGTLLAIGALAFVLYPLFFELPSARPIIPRAIDGSTWTDDVAVAALREIEFDKATGKLSDADYTQLKEQYTRQALASMRLGAASGAPVPADDEIEATLRHVVELLPEAFDRFHEVARQYKRTGLRKKLTDFLLKPFDPRADGDETVRGMTA